MLHPLCLGTVSERPLFVRFLEGGSTGAAPLRLALGDAAGTLRLWAWDAAACTWRTAGEHPGALPTAPATAPTLAYNPRTQTLCCATPAGHVALRQLLPAGLTAAVTADVGEYERCVATPDGTWLVRADAVAFVPAAAAASAVTVAQPTQATRTRLTEAAAAEHPLCARLAAAHPFSHELIVPDAHGRLAVFTPEPDARGTLHVAAAVAGTLEDRAPGTLVAAARAMLVTRHTVALLAETALACFDLASGVAMGAVRVPGAVRGAALWGPGADDPAARCGIWGAGVDGLAALQQPSALAYARALVRAATDADARTPAQRDAAALAAVDVCADWHLDQWVARLAFELLLRGRTTANSGTNNATQSPETVLELAKALAKHVQNPALVAGLLAGRNMNDVLEAELARFLAQTQARADDADRQTAYELCTPLNDKLAAPLAQLLALLRHEKHGAADAPPALFPGARALPLFVDAVDPQTVATLDWQTLATFVRESPRTCASLICQGTGLSLPLLEQLRESPDLPLRALQLSPALLAPLRSVRPAADPARNPALLDMLCAALHADQPRLLPALVPALAASNLALLLAPHRASSPATTARLVAARILKALPPGACAAPTLEASSTWLPDSLEAEQTVAVSRLLEMNGQHLNALLLLLQGDLWDDAVALLARLHEGGSSSSESALLFETALHTALRRRNTECLSKLWPFLPPTMQPLDLVHALACHVPLAENGTPLPQHPLDKSAPFTVGMFREAFLCLFEQQAKQQEQEQQEQKA